MLGFERGWEGLLTNTFRRLKPRNVGGILHLGGTILRTSRSPEFRKRKRVQKVAETLALNKVDGLVVVGGDFISHCCTWRLAGNIDVASLIKQDIPAHGFDFG